MAKKKKMKTEDALYVGLGVASMAKDYFEDFLDFLQKEGKMMKKDRAGMSGKLKSAGKQEYDRMEKMYQTGVEKALKAMNIPTRKEFNALKAKVEGKKAPAKK